MSMSLKRERPASMMGSKALRRSISGRISSMGAPFTLMSPRPGLVYATATAVFLRPKHWTVPGVGRVRTAAMLAVVPGESAAAAAAAGSGRSG
uniref:Uncharacterized protein n=1 Tax=Triticum urartu TaxID=4572 RepID=A0A8R7UDV6_TRIUA